MKICKVCKTENEEQFIYCKNCGAQLELTPPPVPVISEAPVPPVPPVPPAYATAPGPYAQAQYNHNAGPVTPMPPAGLVAVEMILPDPANPEYRCPQTVYVTPAQKAAIQSDAIQRGRRI